MPPSFQQKTYGDQDWSRLVLVVQQTYTDREDGKILTYDLYSSYGSWKGFTDGTDRTNWKWFHGSYEPYGSWKGFTDREYSFSIGERVSLWLSEAWKNTSIRTDRTDCTNWKWLHGSYEPYGSWEGFTDREYSFSFGERVRLWLSEA